MQGLFLVREQRIFLNKLDAGALIRYTFDTGDQNRREEKRCLKIALGVTPRIRLIDFPYSEW